MSTSKSCDTHFKIPKLEASGRNWTMRKTRLKTSLKGRNLLGYLHGSKARPIDPAEGKPPAWIATTIAEMAEVTDYETDLAEWEQKDALVQDQIAATIPESLYIRLISKSASYKHYETLKYQFQECSLVVAVKL
ncbi:hypothetical protein BDN67DRAFT_863623, partial [Paxillus ammoniavirescens]